MSKYECVVASPMSAEEVFEYLADFTNVRNWDPGVSRAERKEGDGPGVGTSYAVTANNIDLVYKTLEYKHPSRTVLEAETSWLRSYDVIEVTPTTDGCTATYRAELDLKGPLSIGEPVLDLTFKRVGDKAAAGMKEALRGEIVRSG